MTVVFHFNEFYFFNMMSHAVVLHSELRGFCLESGKQMETLQVEKCGVPFIDMDPPF